MRTKCLLSFLFIATFFLNRSDAQWIAFEPVDLPNHFVYSVAGVDENTAWGVLMPFNFTASREFVKTSDGGESWTSGMMNEASEDYNSLHIFALDENTAWVTRLRIPDQMQTELLKTTDGGLTWTSQTLPATQASFATVATHFFNENEGTAFAEVYDGTDWYIEAYFTEDGGDTWQLAQTPESSNERIWIWVGNSHYEVIGDKIWFGTSLGRIFHTDDKGKNWVALETGLEDRTIHSLAFKDELHGIAVSIWDSNVNSQPNLAVRTSDGGKTWTQSPIPANPPAASIEHIPGSNGVYLSNFAAFSPGALISVDNGNHWKTISDDRLDCVQFVSPTTGWAGGEKNSGGGPGMYKWTGGEQLFDESLINVHTTSGSGIEGTLDGEARKAKFWNPKGMAMDRQGNLYVADDYNHTIRLVSDDGKVSTFAGTEATRGYANGPADEAQFDRPQDVAVDNQGNLYVADPNNACIRKIGPDGMVSLYAGMPGEAGGADGALLEATFDWPNSLGIDAYDNLYVADGNGIRKIDTEGTVSTILSSGNFIWGMDADAEGNVYFADFSANAIKKLTTDGTLETLAGGNGCLDGPAGRFSAPEDVAVDAYGNVYVADGTNQRVRKVTPDGTVTTLAGDGCQDGFATENKIVDGAGSVAQFGRLRGIMLKPDGNLLVNSWDNDAIREIQIGHQPPPLAVLQSTGSWKYRTTSLNQVEPVTFDGAVINISEDDISGVEMNVRVKKEGITLYNKTSPEMTIASNSTDVLAIDEPFEATETGRYEVSFIYRTDDLGIFFTTQDEFTVTDSLLGVDDGHQYFHHTPDFNGPNAYGSFGQIYELVNGDSLRGFSAKIIASEANFSFGVYNVEGSQIGDKIYASDTLMGVNNSLPDDFYYPLPQSFFLEPGAYFFTIERNDPDGSMGIGADSDVNDLSAYFKLNTSNWTPYRIFWGTPTAPVFMLRPVLKSPNLTPATEATAEPFHVLLSPNPAGDHLQILIEQSGRDMHHVQLYDLTGRLLRSLDLQGQSTATLNLEGVHPGTYLVKVYNEQGMVTRKVVRR